MIQKTKDYSMFKFTEDNREGGIRQSHVNRLVESIQKCNLLAFRPILVDQDFNIIDGQHRTKAAEKLGLEIYYEVRHSVDSEEMILLNIAKTWTTPDYLNYYVKHNYPEYIKLKSFMNENKLTAKVALNMTHHSRKEEFTSFKDGKYVFKPIIATENLGVCYIIIDQIKNFNGHSPYTNSSKFWKALTRMINAPEFELKKWLANFEKFCHKMVAKATMQGYLFVMMEIFNHRNNKKIQLVDPMMVSNDE